MAEYQDRATLDISDVLRKADLVEARLAKAFAVKTGQAIQAPTLKVDTQVSRQLSETDAQIKRLGQTVKSTRDAWQTQALTDDETIAASRRLRNELLKLATAEDANIDSVLRATSAAASAQRTMDQARGTVTKGGFAFNASAGIIDSLSKLGGPAGAAAGTVGQFVIDGLARSMNRGKSQLADESESLSNEIVDALKKKLKIQSPSKVMEEIGGYIMEGLIGGFKSKRELLLIAVRDVASDIPSAFHATGNTLDGADLAAPILTGLSEGLVNIPELFQKAFGGAGQAAAEGVAEVSAETVNVTPAFEGLAAGFEKASTKLAEFPAAAKPAAAAVGDAAEAADEAGDSAQEAGNGFEQLSGFLAVAGTAVTVFTAAVALAVPKAAEFQEGLAAIGTESDLTEQQLTELGAGLLRISGQVGQSSQELVKASYDVVGAGVRGADTVAKINKLTEVSAKAASAGLTDVKTSADIITSALNSYGFSAENAEHVSDVLFKTTAVGKISFNQLGKTMGEIFPKAKTLGVSLEELSASAAALTSSGVPAEQAMTGIGAALDNVLKPSADAVELSKELGLSFNAAALQSQGWSMFLDEIRAKTGGNVELMGRLFSSSEAVNAIFGLTGTEGAPRFKKALDEVTNSAGATDEAFQKQAATFKFAQKQYAAASEAFQIEFGLRFLPLLTKLTKGAAHLITKFDELGQNGVVQFALVTGGVGLAALGVAKLATALKSAAAASALLQGVTAAGGLKAFLTAPAAAVNGLTKVAAFIPGRFLPQLAGANGALANVVTKLGVFGQAGLVAGAAFAGWKIGEWIGKLKLFGDETTTLNDKIQDFLAVTVYRADPALIKQAREDEEALQQKALATKGVTDATIDSGAAERKAAEAVQKAADKRAALLEVIRQQTISLKELTKELGDRKVKLELEGKTEFQRDLGELGATFEALREKFKAPFYVNGALDLKNPKLQAGFSALDAQQGAEAGALVQRELDKQGMHVSSMNGTCRPLKRAC
ncbi:phage tail tape measure protein [Deinococcus sp. QL22]|uniref:phage tail tape measure protein n=1 Tax=Deinococcus sp. QL22 TaxID=2939437 RepID=UPI00201764F5|nr:phage tail tape measure protein [Deinococcus sp. QL22]UQN05449.1 phage tail tape measure protein [Deinococcus sp. QL22]